MDRFALLATFGLLVGCTDPLITAGFDGHQPLAPGDEIELAFTIMQRADPVVSAHVTVYGLEDGFDIISCEKGQQGFSYGPDDPGGSIPSHMSFLVGAGALTALPMEFQRCRVRARPTAENGVYIVRFDVWATQRIDERMDGIYHLQTLPIAVAATHVAVDEVEPTVKEN